MDYESFWKVSHESYGSLKKVVYERFMQILQESHESLARVLRELRELNEKSTKPVADIVRRFTDAQLTAILCHRATITWWTNDAGAVIGFM